MSLTSKSPAAVLRAALDVARQSLPAYSHRCSPKKFTQHQLFACLVLKNFLKTDYRGVSAQLRDCRSLLEVLDLDQVPHYTTLQKAARRLLLSASAKKLLDATVRKQLGRRQCVPLAAIDSTGLECTAASGYFVRRRASVAGPWKTMTYHRYPQLGVVSDVASHFILAFSTRRGPKSDMVEFRPLLDEALTRVGLTAIVADAGYDSEANHCHARLERQVRTIIPPKHGRPTHKPATGRYRRLMQVRFNTQAYRQRAQVETVISMIKRRQGSHVLSEPMPRLKTPGPDAQRHDSDSLLTFSTEPVRTIYRNDARKSRLVIHVRRPGLHRLKTFDEGMLVGASISGTPGREQDWTLDQLGNWPVYVVKAGGTTTLNQSRTHNAVNEIDVNDNHADTPGASITGTPNWADPVYDAAGNMTMLPTPDSPNGSSATLKYDAWNRLVRLNDPLSFAYEYDGQHQRIIRIPAMGTAIHLLLQ